MKTKLLSYISLFASTGTLLCCALPSLLVAVGLGATMAGLVSTLPQLIWLSQHKVMVFGISFSLIALSFLLNRKTQQLSCPADPNLAEACQTSRDWSTPILYFSALIWVIGAFFAFIAPAL